MMAHTDSMRKIGGGKYQDILSRLEFIQLCKEGIDDLAVSVKLSD
jgi:hypothetical protein